MFRKFQEFLCRLQVKCGAEKYSIILHTLKHCECPQWSALICELHSPRDGNLEIANHSSKRKWIACVFTVNFYRSPPAFLSVFRSFSSSSLSTLPPLWLPSSFFFISFFFFFFFLFFVYLFSLPLLSLLCRFSPPLSILYSLFSLSSLKQNHLWHQRHPQDATRSVKLPQKIDRESDIH